MGKEGRGHAEYQRKEEPSRISKYQLSVAAMITLFVVRVLSSAEWKYLLGGRFSTATAATPPNGEDPG